MEELKHGPTDIPQSALSMLQGIKLTLPSNLVDQVLIVERPRNTNLVRRPSILFLFRKVLLKHALDPRCFPWTAERNNKPACPLWAAPKWRLTGNSPHTCVELIFIDVRMIASRFHSQIKLRT